VKGQALGGYTETTFSASKMGQTTAHTSRGLFQMQPDRTLGKETALHLAHCQDPVHNVARMNTEGSTALFASTM
jgi:hypothetical protein